MLSVREVPAVTLVAALPVIGIGFRAWIAAFEAPRSRNLYNARAHALKEYIGLNGTERNTVEQIMHHIAHGRFYLPGEHRGMVQAADGGRLVRLPRRGGHRGRV